ncbi:MAG: HU family DNA-binding protein [Fibrobacter sp.]|jgi:DNA-binding protein HU-beta|nr:HU family DNA-binding protein [Fibrobacter sp.]
MAKSLTQSQIIAKLADNVQLTKKQVKSFLDSLASLAYNEAKNGFTIPGLGKLVLVQRKARMGRNPATGEQIKIPAKKVVKFRVSKAAKDAIVGGAKPAPAKTAKKKK